MYEAKIKTVLIDDEQIALDRMSILLRHFSEIEIIGQSSDSQTCLELIINNEPDLIFIDIEMPGKTGLEVADELQKCMVFSKIIFVTSHDHYAIEAIKSNAFDYILKPVSIKVLKQVIERYSSKRYLNLSKQEVNIVRLLAKGLNSKQIGESLHISRHTVDTHRRKILEKTACKNSVDLIVYATEKNIL